MVVKSFVWLASDSYHHKTAKAYTTKLFTAVINSVLSCAKALATFNNFSHSLKLAGYARAFPSLHSKGRLQALPANIRLALKWLAIKYILGYYGSRLITPIKVLLCRPLDTQGYLIYYSSNLRQYNNKHECLPLSFTSSLVWLLTRLEPTRVGPLQNSPLTVGSQPCPQILG